MVGLAYTLRYIPAREDLDILESFGDRQNAQRKGVEECPAGAVFVINSRGDATAASAGCILATRLQKRGCEGIVTDGGFRDRRRDRRVGHARVPYPAQPAHQPTRRHAVAVNDPIACGGVSVFPGDVIVGDS